MAIKPKVTFIPDFGRDNNMEVLRANSAAAAKSNVLSYNGDNYLKGSRPQSDGSWIYFKSGGKDVTEDVSYGPAQ